MDIKLVDDFLPFLLWDAVVLIKKYFVKVDLKVS